MRLLEAASYDDAILSTTSSRPGSARNTSEKGNPGGGITVGVTDGLVTYRVRSALRAKTGS
jgi:hypothetical protein